ncbi:MAG: hypothetical protein OEV78_01875 [Spirochaetia bacterium]|nr:hypothetical protein [Spirochaetia bacterium]
MPSDIGSSVTPGKLYQQSRDLLNRFSEQEWPESILVSGSQTVQKKKIIVDAIINSLWTKRKNDFYTKEMISKMVEQNEHPDYYHFGTDRIKIGDKKNPDAGSVRHLLDKFLIYSSKFSNVRFIYFEDASVILNEAESALLKSLEEAPDKTHFILSVEESRQLKETVKSRCVEIPLSIRPDPKLTPIDPWDKFWYFSEWKETSAFKTMLDAKWIDYIKDAFDRLSYNSSDFIIFESMGWIDLRKKFKDENQDTQSLILKLSFLPLYCAIRDRSINGKAPEIGAVSLPAFSEKKLIYLGNLMEHFFRRLNVRYFNTRSPAMNVVFFSFLSKLMNAWVK